MGQALSLTYGRFFAEFLEDLSLVRLSLLDQTTCVGLRYGLFLVMLRSFSGKLFLFCLFWRTARFQCRIGLVSSGFTWKTTSRF